MNSYNKSYAIAHEQDPFSYWEYKEIFRLFSPLQNSKILDIGCNTGDLLYLLYKKGYKDLEGLDLNNEAIVIAKKKVPAIKFSSASLESFYKKEEYDIIYALHIIEHFEEVNIFFNKIKELLKKDGICIISCPNRWAFFMRLECFLKGRKHDADPTHKQYFSIIDLKNECIKNGFKVLKYSTLPLDLLTQKILERKNIRVPALFLGGHNYMVIQK
jgi:2-polyprenyl-3-methyl-5-hydroxy-6-metoxy-1,4-benzoquinol methylase